MDRSTGKEMRNCIMRPCFCVSFQFWETLNLHAEIIQVHLVTIIRSMASVTNMKYPPKANLFDPLVLRESGPVTRSQRICS